MKTKKQLNKVGEHYNFPKLISTRESRFLDLVPKTMFFEKPKLNLMEKHG